MLGFSGQTNDVVIEATGCVFPSVIGSGFIGSSAVAEVPRYVLGAVDDRQGHFEWRTSGFYAEVQGEISRRKDRYGQRVRVRAAEVVIRCQGDVVGLNGAICVECL